MKFKKNFKKGFTLVELIVVIAIVAILAAVSVVSYLAFINSANESADIQLVKQLNVCLQADEALHGKKDWSEDYRGLRDLLEGNGFIVENLTKTKSGCDMVYQGKQNDNSIINRYALLKGNDVLYSETTFSAAGNYRNLWIPETAEEAQTLSNAGKGVVLGAEVGEINEFTAHGTVIITEAKVNALKYINTGDEHSVVITTNSSATSLEVYGPGDVVKHYGAVGEVTVKAVKGASYHENGDVAFMEINKGHVVVEESGSVELMYANPGEYATPDAQLTPDTSVVIQVTNNGDIDHAHIVGSGETGKSNADAVNEISSGVTFDYNNNKDQNTNEDVYHHVSEEDREGIAEDDDKVTDVDYNVEEDKTAIVEEAKTTEEAAEAYADKVFWEDCIEGITLEGIGSEQNPYKISTPMQLALVSHNVNNGVEQEAGCYGYDVAWYELLANINLSGKAWTPIGNAQDIQFGGKIIGNDRKIIGLTNGAYRGEITENHTTGHIGETYGLIGFTKGDVTIKNLTLKDVNIDYENAKVCGALIGDTGAQLKQDITNKLEILNVKVNGNVKGYDKAAGLVGYLYNVTDLKVQGCTVDGTISLTNYVSNNKTTKGYRAGGLFGYFSVSNYSEQTTGLVKDCTVKADIVRGDSTADYLWLGGFTSCFNSKNGCDLVVDNFRFTGTDENTLIATKSKNSSNYFFNAFIGVTANEKTIFGNLGRLLIRANLAEYDGGNQRLITNAAKASEECYITLDYSKYTLHGEEVACQCATDSSNIDLSGLGVGNQDVDAATYKATFLAAAKTTYFTQIVA